jgi:hypothetical protein
VRCTPIAAAIVAITATAAKPGSFATIDRLLAADLDDLPSLPVDRAP